MAMRKTIPNHPRVECSFQHSMPQRGYFATLISAQSGASDGDRIVVGRTTGRNRSSALDGLRLPEGSFPHSALLLLGSGRAFEGDQDGGICETLAHASGAQEGPCRVEGPKPVYGRSGFCISVDSQERTKAARPCGSAEAANQARIWEAWNPGCGLAYVSPLSRKHTGRYGRAPTHDSRLLAPQQPQRHQPILAGDIQNQAPRPGKAGRCDSAYGIAVWEQVTSDSIAPRQPFRPQLKGKTCVRLFSSSCSAYWTLMDPDCPKGVSVSV